MCHAGRRLLIAIHLVDDKPIVLHGQVTNCDYDTNSQHTVSIDLEPIPNTSDVRKWIRKMT